MDLGKGLRGFVPKLICKGPGCGEHINLTSKLPHTISFPDDMSTREQYLETFPDQAIVCPTCVWIADYTSADIFFNE